MKNEKRHSKLVIQKELVEDGLTRRVTRFGGKVEKVVRRKKQRQNRRRTGPRGYLKKKKRKKERKKERKREKRKEEEKMRGYCAILSGFFGKECMLVKRACVSDRSPEWESRIMQREAVE